MPSVLSWHSAHYLFAKCYCLPSAEHSANHLFVECSVLGKPPLSECQLFTECFRSGTLCRVPNKTYSAKSGTLDKEVVSGSERSVLSFLGVQSLLHWWTNMAGAKELWRAAVPPKMKFFFWLALHGRLWTAERRKSHGLQLQAACALCDQHDETTDHLLCSCVYAREVWSRLLQPFGFHGAAPQQTSTLLDWW